MNDFNEWSPLNDVWTKHSEQIEKSSEMYYLKENRPSFEDLIWPEELYIGEGELEDVEEFLSKRTIEMIDIIKTVKGIPPDMLSSYILRTLIAGMLWEKERMGE